jgi:transcriptional regulator with XRE-family HTH domain
MAVRPLHAAREDPRPPRSDDDVPHDVALGAELRALRKAKGLTLQQVAQRADVSTGYLSELERDLTRVPISVLRALCDVYEISIGWLLRASRSAPIDERDLIVRAADRTRLAFPGLGISEELLSPNLSGPLELLISTIEPGADSDDYSHEGDEAGVVIDGVLDLWVDGVHHRLETGDSFAFASTRRHRCANSTAQVTRVLWVITPPHY